MSWQLTPIELRSAANCGDGPTLNAHQIIGFLLKRQFVAGSPGPCRSGSLLRLCVASTWSFEYCVLRRRRKSFRPVMAPGDSYRGTIDQRRVSFGLT
jgi:hypothetical protein